MKKENLYGIIAIFFFWYMIHLTGFINPLFLPLPHVVIKKLIILSITLQFWKDISFSLFRIIFSLLFSCLVGIPLGLIIGHYKKLSYSFELIIDFFRSLPVLVLFPLFIFFFGIGDIAKIMTALFSCSLFIIINAIHGVSNSKKIRQQVITALVKPSKFKLFSKVILMDTLPYIFLGIRTGVAIILIVIIVTEMFVGTNFGIGHRIYESQMIFNVSVMYAYIFVAGMLGYLFNKGAGLIEQKYFHWKGK